MSQPSAIIFSFQGPWRRIIYVGTFELIAVLSVTLLLMAIKHDAASAGFTAVGSSTIAVIWNWLFNYFFERWEARQSVRGRSPLRRISHALLFEGGLGLWLIPFMAFALHVSLFEALLLEIGLLAFFLIYTYIFTWVFDHLFGLPQSALG